MVQIHEQAKEALLQLAKDCELLSDNAYAQNLARQFRSLSRKGKAKSKQDRDLILIAALITDTAYDIPQPPYIPSNRLQSIGQDYILSLLAVQSELDDDLGINIESATDFILRDQHDAHIAEQMGNQIYSIKSRSN